MSRAPFSVTLAFRFDDSEAWFHDEFIVIGQCPEEVIIGAKTLRADRIVLDHEKEQIRYSKTTKRPRIQFREWGKPFTSLCVDIAPGAPYDLRDES